MASGACYPSAQPLVALLRHWLLLRTEPTTTVSVASQLKTRCPGFRMGDSFKGARRPQMAWCLLSELAALTGSDRPVFSAPDRVCHQLIRGGSLPDGLPRLSFCCSLKRVAVHDRGLTLHFSAPQRRRQPAGPGGTLLCLAAPSAAEAEEWGGAVRRGVAELRTDLPEGWDVGAMLQGGLGSAVRLVAKTPLPEGSVAAIQRLMDRSFVCKRTQDRCGRPIPVRLEVAQVIGVQNIAAWTEYTKARARVAAAAPPEAAAEGGAQRLEPEVLTHLSCEDGLVKPLLGGVADGANERWLFHGSTPAAVQGIADSEFRVDLAGSHRGTLYGKGVYLAECCSK
ncbi:unnamed protein product, partial [Prorocentrum cordatum]